MHHRNFRLGHPLLVMASFCLISVTFATAQTTDLNELSEAEQRQVQIAEKFLSILERNPRPGTALDRIYGHHIEFGTLDQFMDSLRRRVKESPEDGTGWMLLGLFESHRGNDAEAIAALQNAEKYLPDNALASYYLGQSLLAIGESDRAIVAFETAIDRKPARADLLPIFQQLGRIHQRAQRETEALKVWQRLEALFPDDPRVQEQIATTLVEEGEYDQALPRYEKLATLVKDDYRRTMYQIEAAELKIRLSQREKGLSDFELLLDQLNPDGWLHRDVRRRIEDVFLKAGDQDGLVTYYENWLQEHPEDVDAMARLSRFLADSARLPEAGEWIEKAIKLAPSRIQLRKTYITQLVGNQQYGEAEKQYERLLEAAPGNLDFLRDWGRVVLKNKERQPEERRQEASRIWKKMLTSRPDDATTHAQVADLFRQADFTEEAIALYQQAIELAPEDPRYREYLGEYYHILKRPEDALEIWKSIAEGPRRNATNVARLAEVYNSFGYLENAIEQISAATELDPKDFSLQLKSASYHNRAEKYDAALSFVRAAEKLAANDLENEEVLAQRIDIFQTSRRLNAEIEQLETELNRRENVTAEEWHVLARYYEASRQWANALEALDRARTLSPNSIPVLTTAARVSEISGDFARAADMNRALAEVDRRSSGDHLMNVARLEAQLGRSEVALQAGRDLIVSAPGNTDHYEFYAQLCFRLGEIEQGLDALRKAVRINPNEPALITALGSALADQFRTDEAIEVYWRAFEQADNLDDQITIIVKLTDLHLQLNQFDQLIDRLERDRRQDDLRHAMTICLAQAHHAAGDYGTARAELESLLQEQTRDTNLLQQISKLCEEGSDIRAAIDYQQQLVDVAPSHETEYRLATLLQKCGDHEAAGEIYLKLTQREEDPVRQLRSIDSLFRQQSFESVIAITDPLLAEQRDNWELLYREAVAWSLLNKSTEAKLRLERLLGLKVPFDELGVAAQEKLKRDRARAKSNNLQGLQTSLPQQQNPLEMLDMASTIQQAIGLNNNNYTSYSSRQSQTVWTPDSYGQARMAAYGWLMKFDQQELLERSEAEESPLEERFEQMGEQASVAEAPRDLVYDWLIVERLRGNYDSIFEVAKRLAREGGRKEKIFFLNSLRARDHNSTTPAQNRSGQQATRPPLAEEDLELMLDCYQDLVQQDKQNPTEQQYAGSQVIYASNGRMYVQINGSWTPVGTSIGSSTYFLSLILEELKLADRNETAEQLFEDKLAAADSLSELSGAMNLCLDQENFEKLDTLYQKWIPAAHQELAEARIEKGTRGNRNTAALNPLGRISNVLLRWTGNYGPDQEHDKILKILTPALDLSVEQIKQQRIAASLSRRSRQNYATSGVRTNHIAFYYGSDNAQGVRMSMIGPPPLVDTSGQYLVGQVYQVFKKNESSSDLEAYLQQRVDDADDANRPFEQILLANYFWWQEQQEDALLLMNAAAERFPSDPTIRLYLAGLNEMLRNYDEALDMLEGIAPRDQKLLQARETAVLQLAERLGDIPRARKAAERLFGLRLDSETQLALAQRMKRLGMHDMAESIISRAERRSSGTPSSLVGLMTLYQGQGKMELAKQIAHRLLRQTQPASLLSRRGYTSSSQANSAYRSQALRVLTQTGELDALMTRLEEQLEKSPRSPQLYNQLLEFYQLENEQEKVGELLKTAIENRPNAYEFRVRLGKHLESTGKLEAACDQYLVVMKNEPALLIQDFYQYRNTFTRAKKTDDLAEVLQSINLRSFGQPYYIVDMVGDMLNQQSQNSEEPISDLSIELAKRCFDAFPSYRDDLLRNLYRPEVWKDDRIFELGRQAVIPTPTLVKSQPWYGVDQISSYSSSGQANTMLDRIVNGIKNTPKMETLRKSIEEVVEKSPEWKGGEALLAMIDLEAGRQAEAKQRIERLFDDEELMENLPATAGWIIGQEMEKFDETRDLALALLKKASENYSNSSGIQYSPTLKLIDVYLKKGEVEQARKLLLEGLETNNSNYSDERYTAYQNTRNRLWGANKLLEMELPIDALKLSQKVISDADGELELATQYYGGSRNFEQQARQMLEQALSKIDDSNAQEAVTQLLATPEKHDPSTPLFDIMLKVPTVQTIQSSNLESGLIDVLLDVSQSELISNSIQDRLQALRTDFPEELSVRVVAGVYESEQEDSKLDSILQEIQKIVVAHPLETIEEGRRPTSRQRRSALNRIPLWLLARECLKDDHRKSEATEIAEEALKSARRQFDDRYTIAILYEWGRLALEQGEAREAEKKWSELLEIVTQRPGAREEDTQDSSSFLNESFDLIPVGKIETGTHKLQPVLFQPEAAVEQQPVAPPSPQRGIPPLTISQFRVTIEIARVAAENNMPELSRKAIRESIIGGLPVSDPDAAQSSSSMSGFAPVSGSLTQSGSTLQNSAFETEVARSLTRVLNLWNSSSYPPAQVYELLVPIVFPEHRREEIMIYADSSQLLQERIESLGAVLANWAHQSDNQEDLRSRIAQRSTLPSSRIAGNVLLVQLSLQEKRYENVQKHLQELSTLIEKAPQLEMIQLACHAAIPASKVPELEQASFPILRSAVETSARSAGQNSGSSANSVFLGKLFSNVNRQLAEQGDLKPIEDFFAEYMSLRQEYYSRYSGDYGLRFQWQDMASLANEAAKIGVPELAFDYMGQTVDFSYKNMSRPSLKMALTIVCRAMRQQTPEQQFQNWKEWTLPNENRRTVRTLSEIVSPLNIPERYLNPEIAAARFPQTDMLSNLTELVHSARESNHLEELRELSQAAYDQKLPGAEFLHALVLVELVDESEATKVIEPLAKSVIDRNRRENNAQYPNPLDDYVVYRACLRSPSNQIGGLYRNRKGLMKQAFRDSGQARWKPNVDVEWFRHEASRLKSSAKFSELPELTNWIAVPDRPNLADRMTPGWVVNEGQISYIGGTETDFLYFKYPLTGDFEVSVDCYSGGYQEAHAGYAGTQVESTINRSRMYVKSFSDHDSVTLPQALRRNNDYNRVLIRRHSDGKVEHFLNGHEVYAEQATGTSPWFALFAHGYVATTTKNIRFQGSPEIPREVTLFAGNRMEGWNTRFFNESQRRYRLMGYSPEPNSSDAYSQRNEPEGYDWSVRDGILQARALPAADPDAQSWNFYSRPLLDGETFQYEFFYSPGSKVGHPTLGRTAFLLNEDGVTEHWIVDESIEQQVAEVSSANQITVAKNRRGPEKLPLNPGDWNQVVMTRHGKMASLILNDTEIYEFPLDAEVMPRFGLFRFKQEGMQIRKATLSGPWPEKLTEDVKQNLLATNSELDPKGQWIVSRSFQNILFLKNADAVVNQARSLPDEQAYQLLSRWVLRNDQHRDIRLHFERGPIDPDDSFHGYPDLLDGVLCPAIELVRVADKLGKLEGLKQKVEPLQTWGGSSDRNKAALLLLIAIQADDEEEVLQGLKKILIEQKQGIPKNRPRPDRAAHFVPVLYAATRPQYRFAAFDVAFHMRHAQRTDGSNNSYREDLDSLAGKIQTKLGQYPESPTDPLTQWKQVPYLKSQTAAEGHIPSRWRYDRGVIQHIPSQTWSQLYFQSPLTGKFEIVFERSLHGWREVSVAYGMHSAEPLYDYKHTRINKMMHGTQDVAAKLDILKNRPWLTEFRVQVDGNRVTTIVDGETLHEQTLLPHPDPWIVIQAQDPGRDSWVRNLRIVGEPKIPDQISLIDIWDWAAFRADYYNDWFRVNEDAQNAPWQKVGDEIRGNLRSDRSAKYRQSCLYYQRPMLEDGTIEFETFYVPGEFEVHPTVGNVAFLIAPEGIRGHKLTHAQFEKSGLSPDNTFDLKDAESSVPLKPNAWNSIRLQLVEDRLTVSVNEREVARYQVELPPNRRQFGLFRYSDQTQCRVRKLIYRGDWPKTLPTVDQQQLAYPENGPYPNVAADWKSLLDFSEVENLEGLSRLGIEWGGSPGTVVAEERGLELLLNIPGQQLPENKSYPMIAFSKSLSGDFQTTIDFDELQIGPPKGWGAGIFLRVNYGNDPAKFVEFASMVNSSGQRILKSSVQFFDLAGELIARNYETQLTADSGRFRVIRRDGILHCLYAESDSEKFQLVGTALAGQNPAKIELKCLTSDPDSLLSVFIKRFTVKVPEESLDEKAVSSTESSSTEK
ncbi:MAG: DUF1583 domain-containing protein [Planctomycetaceae bacterium]|nr:DUF1583 domain-containing protein [Planctomycetaceae bacterium]